MLRVRGSKDVGKDKSCSCLKSEITTALHVTLIFSGVISFDLNALTNQSST